MASIVPSDQDLDVLKRVAADIRLRPALYHSAGQRMEARSLTRERRALAGDIKLHRARALPKDLLDARWAFRTKPKRAKAGKPPSRKKKLVRKRVTAPKRRDLLAKAKNDLLKNSVSVLGKMIQDLLLHPPAFPTLEESTEILVLAHLAMEPNADAGKVGIDSMKGFEWERKEGESKTGRRWVHLFGIPDDFPKWMQIVRNAWTVVEQSRTTPTLHQVDGAPLLIDLTRAAELMKISVDAVKSRLDRAGKSTTKSLNRANALAATLRDILDSIPKTPKGQRQAADLTANFGG